MITNLGFKSSTHNSFLQVLLFSFSFMLPFFIGIYNILYNTILLKWIDFLLKDYFDDYSSQIEYLNNNTSESYTTLSNSLFV